MWLGRAGAGFPGSRMLVVRSVKILDASTVLPIQERKNNMVSLLRMDIIVLWLKRIRLIEQKIGS